MPVIAPILRIPLDFDLRKRVGTNEIPPITKNVIPIIIPTNAPIRAPNPVKEGAFKYIRNPISAIAKAIIDPIAEICQPLIFI
ncbi:MAG TPA: hypothetical protein EYP68_08235 [Candidatus Korarchaeota archaeon]|nr:hypothetical protein [Candidatus Korarchaeota archaeon]